LIAGLTRQGKTGEGDDGGFNICATGTRVVSRIAGRHYGTWAYEPFIRGEDPENKRKMRPPNDLALAVTNRNAEYPETMGTKPSGCNGSPIRYGPYETSLCLSPTVLTLTDNERRATASQTESQCLSSLKSWQKSNLGSRRILYALFTFTHAKTRFRPNTKAIHVRVSMYRD
jgi:hypothetical protein